MPDRSVSIAGEVVNADSLPVTARRSLKNRIAETYDELKERYGDALPAGATTPSSSRFRFDVASPDLALTIAVSLYAGLLSKHGIRAGLAISIEDGGPGLLAEVSDEEGVFLSLQSEGSDPGAALGFDQMVDVAGYLAESWSDGQATAVYLKLQHPEASQKELGTLWHPKPISQPAVSQFLEAAEWDLLERTLERSQHLFAG